METSIQVQITPAKAKEGSNTVAYAKVKVGPVWVNCQVDVVNGKTYIKAPYHFVKSLKSETNDGRIYHGGFDKEFWPKVNEAVTAEYEKAASSQSPKETEN